MILAEKIIKLRKQAGWSQEELAEQLGVSRQSVSKWESTQSIPDLAKIIQLSDLFEVSTDFLVKDEQEDFEAAAQDGSNSSTDHERANIAQVSLERANQYVADKLNQAQLNGKGAILCVCAVIPLFFMMAISESNQLGMSQNVAAAIGIIALLAMIGIATSFFIKASGYKTKIAQFDAEPFALNYGVHSVFQDKLEKFMPSYQRRLSIGIFLFITSTLPLILSGIFLSDTVFPLLSVAVLLLIISAGIHLITPVTAMKEAYQVVLQDLSEQPTKNKRHKKEEALAGFYFPLVVAIYLAWSFWTEDWQTTWIIWPVAAVLFAALSGLMNLLDRDS